MNKRKFSLQAYPFIMLLIALVTGIILQDNQHIPLSVLLSCLIMTAAISFLLYCFFSKNATSHLWTNGLLMAAFTFLGARLCYLQNDQNHTAWYGNYLTRTQALEIQLDEAPVDKPKTLLLKTSVKAVAANNKWIAVKGKLWVYVYKKNNQKQFAAGQTFLIPNALVAIRSSGNPFAFDQKKYAGRNGLYHQCFLNADKILIPDQHSSKPGFINHLKESVQKAISNNIADTTTRSLMLAMVINDRTQLEPELVNAYSITGTTHIIAISGMHVILLASIILFIFDKIPFQLIKNSKYLWAMILVWIYIAITGFLPSGQP